MSRPEIRALLSVLASGENYEASGARAVSEAFPLKTLKMATAAKRRSVPTWATMRTPEAGGRELYAEDATSVMSTM